MATVAVERVAMGWRRDAEGTSKGRRVPLTRRDDLHDAEGTSKGLSLDAKGCPFRRRDCPFTRRDRAKGLSLHAKGCAEGAGSQRFSLEFMRYEHARTAPVSAEECACMCSHSSPAVQHNTCLTHRLDNA